MSVRKKALRSPAEEYQKISEVVGKYAVHNSKVGFALRKSTANNDIRTPPDSNHVENIRIVYGNSIARELVEFEMGNELLRFKAEGHMTNVNYSSKKFIFLLFINHRLVDCQSESEGIFFCRKISPVDSRFEKVYRSSLLHLFTQKRPPFCLSESRARSCER
jgi:DNA mismatch repair ATPase MutL